MLVVHGVEEATGSVHVSSSLCRLRRMRETIRGDLHRIASLRFFTAVAGFLKRSIRSNDQFKMLLRGR